MLSPGLVQYCAQHSCVIVVSLLFQPFSFFSSRFVSVQVVHPYSSIDTTAAWNGEEARRQYNTYIFLLTSSGLFEIITDMTFRSFYFVVFYVVANILGYFNHVTQMQVNRLVSIKNIFFLQIYGKKNLLDICYCISVLVERLSREICGLYDTRTKFKSSSCLLKQRFLKNDSIEKRAPTKTVCIQFHASVEDKNSLVFSLEKEIEGEKEKEREREREREMPDLI